MKLYQYLLKIVFTKNCAETKQKPVHMRNSLYGDPLHNKMEGKNRFICIFVIYFKDKLEGGDVRIVGEGEGAREAEQGGEGGKGGR